MSKNLKRSPSGDSSESTGKDESLIQSRMNLNKKNSDKTREYGAVKLLGKHSKVDPGDPSEVDEDTEKIKKKAKIVNEAQSKDQSPMDIGININSADVNTDIEKSVKRIKNKVQNKDEARTMNQANSISEVQLSDENCVDGINKNHPANDCTSQDEEAVLVSDVIEFARNMNSSESIDKRFGFLTGLMESEGKSLPSDNEKLENASNEANEELAVLGKCSPGNRKKVYTCKDEEIQETMHLSSSDVKERCLLEDLGKFPRMAEMPSKRRKLLVLDVNGLLANIVMPAPKDCRGDIHLLGRAIFKRPFCDDFLKFCFQNFDVGIWSSRSKKIIDLVVDYLLGDLKDKLLFCWDMLQSTKTGYKTLDNIHKPLVLKELRRIWENEDPNLHWKKGDYDAANTLLLDDSPYKALLNPLHTAIFPYSYYYMDKEDNSLGPGGDLRVYLEGLLVSDNVQKYVEQHPFGQSAINETNLYWKFYSEVLETMSKKLEDTATHSSAPPPPPNTTEDSTIT